MKAPSILLLVLLWPALAQAQTDNPWHWSAERLLEDWRSGANPYAMGLAFMECPAESPRHDSIFTGIIALRYAHDEVMNLASLWTGAQQRCRDRRLRDWYLAQIGSAATERDVIDILAVFLRLADDAGFAGALSWIVDPVRSVEAREQGVRYMLSRRAAPADHLALFQHLYVLHPLTMELQSGLYDIKKRLGDPARFAILEAVLDRPDAPSAEAVIRTLREYTMRWEHEHSADWKARLRAGLERLRADPQGRVPPNVAATAERALPELVAAGEVPR